MELSRRPYIHLTHCAKLSFCGGCLWGISRLVSWPFPYLSASTSSLAYHRPASFLNIDSLSASTPLMLMFCMPLHFPLTDILHTIVSLHVVSLLVSACRQPPPLVSGLHGGFLCCYSVKCASAFKKKYQAPIIFCQVIFYNSCCVNKFLTRWFLAIEITV